MLVAGNLLAGRYRLTRVLGEGGMGVVWAAVNESFGREVAVKLLLPQVAAGDASAVDRFFNEARICGALRHPGIVDVIDAGRAEDGSPFLVMELLDGAPLDSVLAQAGKLRPESILPVVRDVARTLTLAHDRGIIHRDLKPANLFLHQLPTGQVIAKVLDFGISKVLVPHVEKVKTRTGTVVGSPVYMSPEQAYANVDLDARSDVHSLGVILYEALSGTLPFDGPNANVIMVKIATQDAPPLASVAPGLPRPVVELVHAAMARDRDARIPSAAALADRIEAALSSIGASPSAPVPSLAALREPAPARPQEDSRPLVFARTEATGVDRPPRRTPWVATAAGALFLGGAAAAFVWRSSFTAPAAPLDAATGATAAPSVTAAPAPSTAGPAVTVTPVPSTAEPAGAGAPAESAKPAAAAPPPGTAGKRAPAPTATAAPTAAPTKKQGAYSYD